MRQAREVLRIAAIGAVMGLVLAGCGRKGPLEPPPGAETPPPPSAGEVMRPGPRPTNPDRPFILDGLM